MLKLESTATVTEMVSGVGYGGDRNTTNAMPEALTIILETYSCDGSLFLSRYECIASKNFADCSDIV